MRHLLIILFCGILLTSCASSYIYSYIQVVEVQPETNIQELSDGQRVYDGEDCMVFYNPLLAEGGDTGFEILNKTDEVLLLDLTKSFFIYNNVAYNYDLIKTFNCSEILGIPPHSARKIGMNPLMTSLYLDCDLKRFPEDKATLSFNTESSPLVYKYYLTYKLSDQSTEKTIKNTFYVSSITNYPLKSVVKYIGREKPCQGLTNNTSEKYSQTYPIQVYDQIYTLDLYRNFYLKYELTSSRQLYKSDGGNLYYNPQYNGYTIIEPRENGW